MFTYQHIPCNKKLSECFDFWREQFEFEFKISFAQQKAK